MYCLIHAGQSGVNACMVESSGHYIYNYDVANGTSNTF